MLQKRHKPAPPEASTSPDGAKVALILAAEVIFARDGIEGASLREIATLAGQRNHHAVQYHFGSKDKLLQAVFDYRMDQMEETRGHMLEKAEKLGKLDDVRTISEIIFLPQIDLIDAFGDYSYAAFLNAYLLRYQSSGFGEFGDRVAPNLARTLKLLRHCLKDLPETVAQRRLVTVCFIFLYILAVHTREGSNGAEPFDAVVHDTLEQIVAALIAPHKTH